MGQAEPVKSLMRFSWLPRPCGFATPAVAALRVAHQVYWRKVNCWSSLSTIGPFDHVGALFQLFGLNIMPATSEPGVAVSPSVSGSLAAAAAAGPDRLPVSLSADFQISRTASRVLLGDDEELHPSLGLGRPLSARIRTSLAHPFDPFLGPVAGVPIAFPQPQIQHSR